MLVLSRMPGQSIMIGDDVEITIVAMDALFVTLQVREEQIGGAQDGEVQIRDETVERDGSFKCGKSIEITVVDIRPDKCRIGVSGCGIFMIHRKEVYDEIRRMKREGGGDGPGCAAPK